MPFLSYLAALFVAIVPAVIAADNGGVLPWTQWVAGCAAAVALVLTLPALLARGRVPLRAFSVAICLLLFAGIAAFQTLPLPPSLLNAVASGSAATYQQAVGILDSQAAAVATTAQSDSYPISVAPWLTKGSASLLVVLAAFGLASSQLFVTRQHITVLLVCLAVTGALQGGLGIYQTITDPDATIWGVKSHHGGFPFGTYISRSAAAVTMNLGLAASLGLVAWRLAAMTGASLYNEEFPFSELLDVAFDRVAMLGVVCALLSVAGLLACGSRGGLIGAIAGLLLAFGLVQSLHRGRGLVPVLLAVALMAAILLVNFNVAADSFDRLQETPDQVFTDRGIQDGRIDHWKDGWRAALAQPALGWGLGAYPYAYLPFQRTSPAPWFKNADNLWLEWFVEAGVLGIVLAIAALAVVAYSLNSLNASPDPIDHGLATAGWFAIGAMAASQFFDFGLRIPANSIAATLIGCAVVGRNTMTGFDNASTDRGRMLNRRPLPGWLTRFGSRPLGHLGLAAVVAIALFPSLRFLDVEARADHVRRLARYTPRGEQFNPEVAEKLRNSLQTHVTAHPDDAAAHLELSSLLVDSARYNAAKAAARDPSTPDWLANYRNLSLRSLRTVWYQTAASHEPNRQAPVVASDLAEPTVSPAIARSDAAVTAPLFPIIKAAAISSSAADSPSSDNSPPTAADLQRLRTEFGVQLHAARQHACDALRVCPLSDEAYGAIARLDFAGGSVAQTEQILSQMVLLRNRNARSLWYTGRLAAQAELWTLASDAWRSAVRINPAITLPVLQSIPKDSPLTLVDVIPNDPAAVLIAAEQELHEKSPDRVWLARAAELLKASLPEDRIERVQWLQLIARIHTARQQFPQAAQAYAQAVALVPGDTELRYQYILALKAAGELDQARQQARAGRKIAPNDPRFERLINQGLSDQ